MWDLFPADGHALDRRGFQKIDRQTDPRQTDDSVRFVIFPTSFFYILWTVAGVSDVGTVVGEEDEHIILVKRRKEMGVLLKGVVNLPKKEVLQG